MAENFLKLKKATKVGSTYLSFDQPIFHRSIGKL